MAKRNDCCEAHIVRLHRRKVLGWLQTMISKENSVRIISGKYKSRKITFPGQTDVRPTGNRIRESLFNWIQLEICNSRCLDLFAGSGALGIEALSRGAAIATFIELNRDAAFYIKKNLDSLGATNGNLIVAEAISWLKCSKDIEPFNIVFLDPPFKANLILGCFHLLESNHMIADNGSIYIETETEFSEETLPKSWRLTHKKQAGKVSYYLYKKITKKG